MRILICAASPAEAGMGHLVRCQVLVQLAREMGHHVTFHMGDKDESEDELYVPDWLVLDFPQEPQDWLFDLSQKRGTKICLLNGIGYDQDNARADLCIVQGLADAEFSGPNYVILRRELFTFKRWVGQRWFVYGGANDKMGLLSAFRWMCPGLRANLLTTKYMKSPEPTLTHRILGLKNGMTPFQWMASAKAACISMGMTAWELAVLGVPVYVFSVSDGHLEFAQRMEEEGYLKAWPETDLPETGEEMREFLAQPNKMGGEPPDGKAAERIVNLMVERL